MNLLLFLRIKYLLEIYKVENQWVGLWILNYVPCEFVYAGIIKTSSQFYMYNWVQFAVKTCTGYLYENRVTALFTDIVLHLQDLVCWARPSCKRFWLDMNIWSCDSLYGYTFYLSLVQCWYSYLNMLHLQASKIYMFLILIYRWSHLWDPLPLESTLRSS